jgi:hypothetical protein
MDVSHRALARSEHGRERGIAAMLETQSRMNAYSGAYTRPLASMRGRGPHRDLHPHELFVLTTWVRQPLTHQQ